MGLRRILVRHPAIAAWLLAATLLLRLLVPVGFMPAVSGGTVRLILCSGMAQPAGAAAMPGMTSAAHMAHHAPAGKDQPQHAEMPCAFAGLGLPVLGGGGIALLAGVVALAGLRLPATLSRLPIAPADRLRPPLRAPPLLA